MQHSTIKQIVLLAFLMAIAYGASAQDTITGVVSRVAAPCFEQNVCDSRFAISTEGGTYYVMVDNYWPNPYLEDLVIRYDTIPLGDEIEVVGTIVEMEDGNGNAFQTIDISKNLNSTRRQVLGFFGYSNVSYPGPDPISAARFVHYNGTELYYITINGELQTENPLVVNGRTLVNNKRYLFIGDTESWADYNGNSFNVLELMDALPYDVEDINVAGTLTMENDLYLSLFDGEERHYLTNKRKLIDYYINESVFKEGDSVVVGGYEYIRYDLYGAPFKALEVIKLQSNTEHTLVGGISFAPMPYIGAGPPVPGVDMSFCSGIVDYYLMNPNNGDGIGGYYVVGNDTIQATGQQITATLVASVFVNNYQNILYRVYINHVEFEEHEETLQCTLAVESNPFYWGDMLVVRTPDNETYYLKQFIYEYTAPDHITVGDKTVYVGDSFTATGTVSHWYYDKYYLKKVIDITAINGITELAEDFSSETMAFPNPADNMFYLSSEDQSIARVDIFDSQGNLLQSKPCTGKMTQIDCLGSHGLLFLRIELCNGKVISQKIVVK